MRVLSVVFTDPVAYKGIAIACNRNIDSGIKRVNIVHPILMSVTMKKIATTEVVAIPKRRSLVMAVSRTTSSPYTLGAFIVPSEWLIWSLSNLLTEMKSCVSFARFLT